MPEQGISLLPQEVKERRVEEARLSRLRKVGLVFLFLSVFLALLSFVYFSALSRSLSQTNQSIADWEEKIESLQSVEKVAYDVEQRSAALGKLFAGGVHFSYLLAALDEATTDDVKILELSVPSAESADISGSTRSYTGLAKFLLALKGDSTRGSLFTRVALKEVSLDPQTGTARFDVSLSISKGGLSPHE